MIKIGVFDFDGTLVDSNAIKMEGFFRLAARCPEGEAAMAEVIGTSGDRRSILSAFSACMASAGVRLNVDELVTRYSEHVDSAVAAAPEVQGATELLVNLRNASLRLYVSSATPVASLFAILRKRGWMDSFVGIHGSPQTKSQTLRDICEAQSANSEEIVVIGDGIDDYRAALSIGAQFVAVGSGSYAAAHPNNPTLQLRDVAEHLVALQARALQA